MQLPYREVRARRAIDLLACRKLLRDGSRTFLAASRLLPEQVCDAACALYAFCRLADDAVDGVDGETARLAAVSAMRERLAAIYQGAPGDWPADRVLTEAVSQYQIPRALFEALLEGFAWDARARRYPSLEELHAYAMRVAGTVGVMMSLIMGVRQAELLERACELGMAMQLSNIARDVGEDARAGRLYLPLEWMREAKLDPDTWMLSPAFDERLATVVERLLDHAETLYQRAGPGIAKLPWRVRPAIQLASAFYAEIGHEVARAQFDSVSRRAVVAPGRKAKLLARTLVMPLHAVESGGAPLAAARFLVGVVQPDDTTLVPIGDCTHQGRLRWYRLDQQAKWLIELFERLEQRDLRRGGVTRSGVPGFPGTRAG